MSEVPDSQPPPSEGIRYHSEESVERFPSQIWERTPPKGGMFDTPKAEVEALAEDDTGSVKSKRSSKLLKISLPAAAIKSALGLGKKAPKPPTSMSRYSSVKLTPGGSAANTRPPTPRGAGKDLVETSRYNPYPGSDTRSQLAANTPPPPPNAQLPRPSLSQEDNVLPSTSYSGPPPIPSHDELLASYRPSTSPALSYADFGNDFEPSMPESIRLSAPPPFFAPTPLPEEDAIEQVDKVTKRIYDVYQSAHFSEQLQDFDFGNPEAFKDPGRSASEPLPGGFATSHPPHQGLDQMPSFPEMRLKHCVDTEGKDINDDTWDTRGLLCVTDHDHDALRMARRTVRFARWTAQASKVALDQSRFSMAANVTSQAAIRGLSRQVAHLADTQLRSHSELANAVSDPLHIGPLGYMTSRAKETAKEVSDSTLPHIYELQHVKIPSVFQPSPTQDVHFDIRL